MDFGFLKRILIEFLIFKMKVTKYIYSIHSEYRNENGRLHREDGPAIEYDDGSEEWFLNGKYHRENGPAIIYIGSYKSWCNHGKYHRLDGPAVDYDNGEKKWFLNGKHISVNSQKEFERYLKLIIFQ